jgi:hypothetical protein
MTPVSVLASSTMRSGIAGALSPVHDMAANVSNVMIVVFNVFIDISVLVVMTAKFVKESDLNK